MRKGIFLKILTMLLLLACVLQSLLACNKETPPADPPENPGDTGDTASLPDAPSGAILSEGETQILLSGEYRLTFGKTGAVAVETADDHTILFSQSKPASVKVRGKGQGIGVETYSESTYSAAYTSITAAPYGYECLGTVTTKAGSVFSVCDAYYLTQNGQFGIERKVNVVETADADVGFASILSFINGDGSNYYDDFDYFIPSILYKDDKQVVSGAIASNLDLDRLWVKETRTGLPMVMAYHKANGYGMALAHIDTDISVGTTVGGGAKGEVNNELQYGAVGVTILPSVSVDFVYPCTEGPTTYDSGSGMIARYHTVAVGTSHSYRVGLIPTTADCYTDAMVECYQNAYETQNRYLADIDMKDIYEQTMDLFTSEYREYTYNGKVVSAGLPWSLDLPDATNKQGVSLQMGFVGQQIPAGFQMYRWGLDNGDETLYNQGKNIIDFWANQVNRGGYFPIVWWDPADTSTGGTSRNYPSFLRCMVDGMEGMLDAYRISVAYGTPQQSWLDAVKKVASHLVEKQNDDGSFYRAYTTGGSVCTDTSNATYQGTSKLNTPIAVRFLAKMYELTGEEMYKESALRAAEFSYETLYCGLGKYVGGTPDNPNTVDKEAAVYAMYCFTAAYQLGGGEKFMKAAEHAAVSTMSWTYVYDFAVPNGSASDVSMNPFANGGVIGFSVIATGHSGADNYSAYAFYEMYKMYLFTGNAFYRNAALLLQIDTKLSTDYDGRVGYAYRAMMPEATNVADFAFKSVKTWLPWSGVANIEPIGNLWETFGVYNIQDITLSEAEQLELINSYGCGGNAVQRGN